MIDTRPRYVARPRRARRRHSPLSPSRAPEGLEIAVRAGGHSVAGAGLVDDGLVLDVRGMADIEVDPEGRVVRVAAARPGRRSTTRPSARAGHDRRARSTTGVAGLTLGGGSGWLEREHGLACDNVLAVELVTADGRVRSSADRAPRTSLGDARRRRNFGVVTALEFRAALGRPE